MQDARFYTAFNMSDEMAFFESILTAISSNQMPCDRCNMCCVAFRFTFAPCRGERVWRVAAAAALRAGCLLRGSLARSRTGVSSDTISLKTLALSILKAPTSGGGKERENEVTR